MGLFQAKQPKRSKVGIGPARLVGTICLGTPFPMTSFAQDASQSATDESIFHAECRAEAVLEIFKPAPQRPVHVGDDLGHAVPGGPLGLRPDRVSEFLAAFAARPAFASLEVVAEKVARSSRAMTATHLGDANQIGRAAICAARPFA